MKPTVQIKRLQSALQKSTQDGEWLMVTAETLGTDLQLEAKERAVGPFRADILCKDIGTNSWVLVENQLERTDHSHLGQPQTAAIILDGLSCWADGL